MFPPMRASRSVRVFGGRIGALWLLAAACRQGPAGPPAASFLVVAGDSTFWVDSDGGKIGTRRSPLMLARVEGRYHELYVVDEDLSYYDALLAGQRVYRRDIVSGDSALVRYDSSIARLARAYAASHPREQPLDPDEDTADDPTVQATTDTELLDVIGPYLSYEFHLDVDIHGERDQHVTQRGVVDIRDGRRMRLEHLAGQDEANRAYAEAQTRLAAALDSIRRTKDERATRALPTIAGFTFDSSSFELLGGALGPTVAFLVPGRGPRAGGYSLPLGEIALGAPAWWKEVVPTLPNHGGDAAAVWSDSLYDIAVAADSGGTTARLELRRGSARWPATSIPIPVRRIYRLPLGPRDTATSHALTRAFDEAEAYGGSVRAALRPFPSRVVPAALGRPGRSPPSAHPVPWRTRPHTTARRSSPTS